MPTPTEPKQTRKEHLLQIAFELFNRQGYHATGIDQILAESGVAKATLYKYFKSKEELILQVLQQRHDQVKAMNLKFLEDSDGDVLSLFDALDHWFQQADFRGCNFIQASVEFIDSHHPIHQSAANHKRWLKALICQHLKVPAKEKNALAEQILMLLDGAIVSAQVRNEKKAAQLAKQLAKQLLNKQVGY